MESNEEHSCLVVVARGKTVAWRVALFRVVCVLRHQLLHPGRSYTVPAAGFTAATAHDPRRARYTCVQRIFEGLCASSKLASTRATRAYNVRLLRFIKHTARKTFFGVVSMWRLLHVVNANTHRIFLARRFLQQCY